MAEVGYTALLIAFAASIYSAIAFIFGARKGHEALIASARRSLLAVCWLVSLSVALLATALITHNFQIEYVASYTSSDLSLPYLISALWAGNAGSLLFWGWLLSVFAAMVMLKKRDRGRELVPYALAIVMLTEAFFLVLLLVVSNPFQKLTFTPVEGIGLNPLLQNPGMIIHPPLLLAGYAAFTIPFAFAIAALLTKRLGDDWIIAVRRWTLMAWLLLGIGILFGAWWAYVELGWGGYWVWDPVENASLMPWLVATAFLHSTMMQRRRGMLKRWNMVLIIIAFSLTLFGTFLTRSGVIASVHAFAGSILGAFFLAFIGVTLIGSLGLLFYRRKEVGGEAEMESLISRESTFLLNNLLLVSAAFAILVGTIFPVISEWVRGVKVSVGPPFFNQVNVPIFLAIILLAGVCTLIGWRRASAKNLVRNFLWPLVGTLILGLVLFLAGIRQWYALVAFLLCGFVFFTILFEWFRGTRARHRMRAENYGWRQPSIKKPGRNFLWPEVVALVVVIAFWYIAVLALVLFGAVEWYALVAFFLYAFAISVTLSPWFRHLLAYSRMTAESYLKAFWGLIWANRPRYGGYIVHISILLIAVGIIGSSAYDVEKQATLMPGESMTINGYTLTYEGMEQYQTQRKGVVSATLSIYNEGKLVGRLVPEKHYHLLSEQWMTEVAIRSTPAEDLYVILAGWDEDGSATFKVLVNPLVSWMWVGGGVMLVGGLIAFWPERRRLLASEQTRKGRE